MSKRTNEKVQKKVIISRKGFTLIELLVVIAIIALLLSIIVPSLRKAKTYAQRVMCTSNLRQQCLGITMYSNDNDNYVPELVLPGSVQWLWTVTFYFTNQIADYSGMEKSGDAFFCPANKDKKPTDARYWQYGWIFGGSGPWTGGPPYMNEEPLADETHLTILQQKQHCRIPPTVYMLDRYDQNGDSILCPTLKNGKKANWIRKLSNVHASGSKAMLGDVILEGTGLRGQSQFFEITQGGIGAFTGGAMTDNSNHKSSQTFSLSSGHQGEKPQGGNIGYADGHVEWKNFDEMEGLGQIAPGAPTFWW